MNKPVNANSPLRRNLIMSFVALLASGGTLVCCVLPAVMVALGAGAALAGMVTEVPQLIWLSVHKAGVFAVASFMLVMAGTALHQARSLPCPADPGLAKVCSRLRRASVLIWLAAVACVVLGATFAFVLPRLMP